MPDNQKPNQTDELFAEEIGAIVMESAALKFLSTIEPDQQEEFQNFVEANAAEEDLIEKIGQKYPTFLEVLQSEVESMQNDLENVNSYKN
tara:strand:- start:8274 stop:8543 length:270 start_codon:yes stop_codon:yes gene_type:complete